MKNRGKVQPAAQSSSLSACGRGRTLADYVRALRVMHTECKDSAAASPFAEEARGRFCVVEPGASVDPSAAVLDSVVLSGGVVEAGATVVRSVVCPGGVVRKKRTIVDQVVKGALPADGRDA